MKIISIDVGIKNLAFCLLSVNKKNDNLSFKIIKWDIINIGEETPYNCQYINCNKPAKFQTNNICFCLKHSKNSTNFKIPPPDLKMSYINKQKIKILLEIADKYNIKYIKPIKKTDLVNVLYNYIKPLYFEPIVNIDASKINLVTIGRNINLKMNSIFYSVDNNDDEPITHVIIENQISPIANRMKTIQGMIAQYFIMKNVENIEFISSINKLKCDTIINDIEDESMSEILTYNNRKKIGVKKCLELLENTNSNMLQHFKSHKKKDDLADSLLQSMWYINNKLQF